MHAIASTVMEAYEIVLLGSWSVKKRGLIEEFTEARTFTKHEDESWTRIVIEDKPILLCIKDTTGTEYHVSQRDEYMKNGQGFILVYSITQKSTLTGLEHLRKHISVVKGLDLEEIPLVLVGNECHKEGEREVGREEGEALAKKWGCPFFEVSTKTGGKVDEAFMNVAHQVHQMQKQKNLSKYL